MAGGGSVFVKVVCVWMGKGMVEGREQRLGEGHDCLWD